MSLFCRLSWFSMWQVSWFVTFPFFFQPLGSMCWFGPVDTVYVWFQTNAKKLRRLPKWSPMWILTTDNVDWLHDPWGTLAFNVLSLLAGKLSDLGCLAIISEKRTRWHKVWRDLESWMHYPSKCHFLIISIIFQFFPLNFLWDSTLVTLSSFPSIIILSGFFNLSWQQVREKKGFFFPFLFNSGELPFVLLFSWHVSFRLLFLLFLIFGVKYKQYRALEIEISESQNPRLMILNRSSLFSKINAPSYLRIMKGVSRAYKCCCPLKKYTKGG